MNFSHAKQIQPRNGAVLLHYRDGINLINPRVWSDADRRDFPQAERPMEADEVLLVDVGATGFVFAVPLPEALRYGLPIDTITIGDDTVVFRSSSPYLRSVRAGQKEV
jgi:hypothetical protein